MKKKIIYIIAIIFLLISCQSNKNRDNHNLSYNIQNESIFFMINDSLIHNIKTLNNNIFNNDTTDLEYIKIMFSKIDSFSLLNYDMVAYYKRLEETAEYLKWRDFKKMKNLKKEFVKKYICNESNMCFGKLHKIYYLPIGYIEHDNYLILIYEKYKMDNTLYIYRDIYAISFDTINTIISDKLKIFQAELIGVSPGNISCNIRKNEINLSYQEKFVENLIGIDSCYIFTEEKYKLNICGKFKLINSFYNEKYFNKKEGKWIKQWYQK